MDNKLNEIIELLNKQNEKINLLNEKIENQNIRLTKLESYGNRMDNHITLVEYTYQSLIKPIDYIKNYLSDNNLLLNN